jgi:hypothetical protein
MSKAVIKAANWLSQILQSSSDAAKVGKRVDLNIFEVPQG